MVKTIALEGRGRCSRSPPPGRAALRLSTTILTRPSRSWTWNRVSRSQPTSSRATPRSNGSKATNLNPKGDRLDVYELPLKQSLGRYQHEEPRFRVFDTATNQVVKTLPAPEQTMSFAFSPDGKRIYAFCIGQDILVLDSEDGHRLGTIPLAHRNITGIRATYGLPILANYQEQDYVLSFAIIVEDSITDTDTLALGVIDLKQQNPTLQIAELEPFVENSVHGRRNRHCARSAQGILRVERSVEGRLQDPEREAQVSLANSQAVPLIHPDGKKGFTAAASGTRSTCTTPKTSSISPTSNWAIRWRRRGCGSSGATRICSASANTVPAGTLN